MRNVPVAVAEAIGADNKKRLRAMGRNGGLQAAENRFWREFAREEEQRITLQGITQMQMEANEHICPID